MSRRFILLIMTIISAYMAFIEIKTDFLFGLFLFITSFIFLFGIVDSVVEKKLATAHLMVGGFVFSIFAFFRILEFASSYLGTILGEEPKSITLHDILLIVTGFLSFFVFLREMKKFRMT